jgi:hypothetical protein
MGIETFFFISLAVTFLLLVALVYHFHQKFVTLDQRVNNIIEIINSVVKEMQNIKQQKTNCCLPVPAPSVPTNPYNSANECINIPADSFIQTNVSLGNFSEIPTDNIHISEDEYDEDDDSDDDEDSDMEDSDDDDDDDQDVKDEDTEKIVVSDDEDNVVLENIVEISDETQVKDLDDSINIISNTDYKKMDIYQLRAIVNAKGVDAKKMKKAELLKFLEQ